MIVGIANPRGWFTPAPRAARDLRRLHEHIATDDAIRRHLDAVDDLYTRRGSWAADLIGEAS